jgi:hypothetical protein
MPGSSLGETKRQTGGLRRSLLVRPHLTLAAAPARGAVGIFSLLRAQDT